MQLFSAEKLFSDIIQGDIASLGKGITLIESQLPKHREEADKLLELCMKITSKSWRIGITGVPGVGKSTFIEALGTYLIQQGKKVAVLAVDPSSTLSGGSILGDKTRMEKLSKSEHAFVRPSPAGKTLGGVTKTTRETILLCEAAGYDIILVETVGVGQSETAVHQMVDFFLLLKLAGAGDELQGIKRGIIEMADLVAINKAEGGNLPAAKLAKNQMTQALHLFPPKANQWNPRVFLCSALQEEGIAEIWENTTLYFSKALKTNYINTKRNIQNRNWFLESFQHLIWQFLNQDQRFEKIVSRLSMEVEKGKTTPYRAAEELSKLLLNSEN